MKLNSSKIFIILVVVLFGFIYLSKLGGLWITESKKEVKVIDQGELIGMPDPEDIRGSYSLGDIENNFDIPVNDMAKAFGIENDNLADFQIKELENIYVDLGEDIEIGTESVRIFVSMYKDIPFEWSGDIPNTAVEVLKSNNMINESEEAYLAEHSIDMNNTTDNQRVDTEIDHEQSEEAPTVNGKTTVKDLINSGIDERVIIDTIGSYANENMLLRDICNENGVSFSVVKTKFTEMLESN